MEDLKEDLNKWQEILYSLMGRFLIITDIATTAIIWLHFMACGILGIPGIEPMPPALQVWSLNHCTTREVPRFIILNWFALTKLYIWFNP